MSLSSSRSRNITRRGAVKLLGGAVLSSVAAPAFTLAQTSTPTPKPLSRLLTDLDLDFLEDLQHAACLYFMEQADPSTGKVLDRATNKNTTGKLDNRFVASIAATGFGLTALCIADRRGYSPTDRLKKQVITTLQFHLDQMPNAHGVFYNDSDVRTGQPLITSEVTSIDTAILLCGARSCRAYFNDPTITK